MASSIDVKKPEGLFGGVIVQPVVLARRPGKLPGVDDGVGAEQPADERLNRLLTELATRLLRRQGLVIEDVSGGFRGRCPLGSKF